MRTMNCVFIKRSLYRPLQLQEVEAPRILCVYYPRVIGDNYTVSFIRFKVFMAVKIQIGYYTV
jgi:hypothetical protein